MSVIANQEDLASFHEHLQRSKKIMALVGAGLSAASGLPTFRGPGGMWRTHEATDLATPEAWEEDAGLVWQFYGYRRHMALNVKPNAAHYALAELARKKSGFQCLSQNVDGLSQRTGHDRGQLQLLHGTLFDVKCNQETCDYRREDFTDPFFPALALPSSGIDPTTNAARQADISDPSVEISKISLADIPACPKCKTGRLRPGVVWFGEQLPQDTTRFVNKWIREPEPVELILVIGTSAKVYPAAGYVSDARRRGTRVAVINMDANDMPPGGWQHGDWLFQGDASKIVPELLRPVVGEITIPVDV